MSKYTKEVFDSAIEGSNHVAQKIKELIEKNNAEKLSVLLFPIIF